jgi:hypothetical protein
MPPRRDEITENLAERWCGQVARRDEARVARRLYRQPGVDGVYRLDAGAWLDDVFPFLQAFGVMAVLEQRRGAAMDRVMGPFVQDVVLDGRKTLCGLERLHALPALWCREEARLRLVGFKAPQVRPGGCHRGRTKRPGERTPGPIGPETVAHNRVPCHWRALAAVCNGVVRALAKAGVVGKRGTGMADGPALETPERDQGCGQATRTRRSEEQWGRVQESEVSVDGWTVLLLLEAVTTIPLAVKGVQMQEHEARWTRALGSQARAQVAGSACLYKVVLAQGFWAGTDLWGLEQQGSRGGVPAQANMAVTAEARALAAAGEGVSVGRRVHTVRHGPGRPASRARLEPEVVGITGLPTEEP